MIEVKRIVFGENGEIKEVEFYPGVDIAFAMRAIETMRLTTPGNRFERKEAIEAFITSNRAPAITNHE